jgi:DNA-binding beta-propeller fold protein YncE
MRHLLTPSPLAPRAPRALSVLAALALLMALSLSTAALGATKPKPKPSRPPVTTLGTLAQLPGASSIAVSPDGSYVYSAAFASSAVGVFKRVTKSVSRG